MAEIGGFAQAFAGALAEVAPVLDERARRLLMGAAARQLGRGGITLIAAATGASKDTVGRGAGELEAGVVVDGRIRATGAGRKLVEHHDPGLWPALDELVDPETRGDPMSRLRWTTKSTVKLADELAAQGHQAGPDTVARLLKDHDYSLQGNAKTIEGASASDRRRRRPPTLAFRGVAARGEPGSRARSLTRGGRRFSAAPPLAEQGSVRPILGGEPG